MPNTTIHKCQQHEKGNRKGIVYFGAQLVGTKLYRRCPEQEAGKQILRISSTRSSTLYLSTIMDLYNNEIAAYNIYDHQQTPLVIDTLNDALERRGYPEGIIVHSDQESVYTSYAYQNLIKKKHAVSSMSWHGNSWDNAVIESFNSNIKSEEFPYTKFNSLNNLQIVEKVKEYIR